MKKGDFFRQSIFLTGIIALISCIAFVFVSCNADVVWGKGKSFDNVLTSSTETALNGLPKVTYTFYSEKLSENPNAKTATMDFSIGSRFMSCFETPTSTNDIIYNGSRTEYLPAFQGELTSAMKPGYYVTGWCFYKPDNESATYDGFIKQDESNEETVGILCMDPDSGEEYYDWKSKTKRYTYNLSMSFGNENSPENVLNEQHNETEFYNQWNTTTKQYNEYVKRDDVYTYGIVTRYQLDFVAAGWFPRSDTRYSVQYWLEDPDWQEGSDEANRYYLDYTKTFTGTTDETVIVFADELYSRYAGQYDLKAGTSFTQELTIKGDGSAVAKFYLNEKIYGLTVNAGTGGRIVIKGDEASYDSVNYYTASYGKKHGATLNLTSRVEQSGYRVAKWTERNEETGEEKIYERRYGSADPEADFPKKMPAFNVTYTPEWELIPITYNLTWHYACGNEDVVLSASEVELLGLPTVHENTHSTSFTLDTSNSGPFYDSESTQNVFVGIYKDSASCSTVTPVSSVYTLAASEITYDTDLYIKLNLGTVYIDSTNGSDSNLGYTKNIPVKTVQKAKNLLINTSSPNATLQVMRTLSSKADIENLSGLTSSAYGNAIVKRHTSCNSSTLLNITQQLSLTDVTLDGGAVFSPSFSAIESNPASAASVTNTGVSSNSPLIVVSSSDGAELSNVSIRNCWNTATDSSKFGGAIRVESSCVGGVTLSNVSTSSTYSYGAGAAVYVASGGKLSATDCSFHYGLSRNGNGGSFAIAGGGTLENPCVSITNSEFKMNLAKNHGGALYITSGAVVKFTATSTTLIASNSANGISGEDVGGKGSFAYCEGNLILAGSYNFANQNLGTYLANSSMEYPVVLTDGFTNSESSAQLIIECAEYLKTSSDGLNFGAQVLSLAGDVTTLTIASAKSSFKFADDTYSINDFGYVAVPEGTSMVTPILPISYTAKWSVNEGKILFAIKNPSGSSVTPSSATVYVYQGGDLVSGAISSPYSWPAGVPLTSSSSIRIELTIDDFSYELYPEFVEYSDYLTFVSTGG